MPRFLHLTRGDSRGAGLRWNAGMLTTLWVMLQLGTVGLLRCIVGGLGYLLFPPRFSAFSGIPAFTCSVSSAPNVFHQLWKIPPIHSFNH